MKLVFYKNSVNYKMKNFRLKLIVTIFFISFFSTSFAQWAAREGALMVELLLLLIGEWTTPQFDSFMRRLAGPANLIDKLRDSGIDFQHGEIAIAPTPMFQLILRIHLLWRIVCLLPFCLRNWRLIRWGAKAMLSEWFCFDIQSFGQNRDSLLT